MNPQQRKRKVIFNFIQPDTPLDTRNVSAILNRKRMNALFHGIEMCSGQIGCEVNKHYFSIEFSYKMTRNLPMRIEKKKNKERRKKAETCCQKEEKKGCGAGSVAEWVASSVAGWLVVWLAGLVAGLVAGCVAGWFCGWVAGSVAGWLVLWLAGWLAEWLVL